MEHISKAQVKLIRSLQQKKYRDELGLFVAEGEKCVEELSRAFDLVTRVCEGENATRTEIEQMSGVQTPQGVIGVFRKPEVTNQPFVIPNGLTLALDGIQNPGNLGTIIRTCDWFGVHDIYCSRDTADCFNPKVVQATMGALARVRIHYVDLPAWLTEMKNREQGVKIYGTLLEGKNMYEVLDGEKGLNSTSGIIIMGNEGNGISEEVKKYISCAIRIPAYNPKDSEVIESLNVSIATAIVLAEFRRLSR